MLRDGKSDNNNIGNNSNSNNIISYDSSQQVSQLTQRCLRRETSTVKFLGRHGPPTMNKQKLLQIAAEGDGQTSTPISELSYLDLLEPDKSL